MRKKLEIDTPEIIIEDNKRIINFIDILFYPLFKALNIMYPNQKDKHKFNVYTIVLGLTKGYSIDAINFILNQAKLESDDFKSNVYQNTLNAIGMRCVYIRETTQTGCYDTTYNGNFGIYDSIYNCVKDRYLWGSYFNEAKTFPEIEEKAKQYYNSSDKNYTEKINALDSYKWCIYLVISSLPITVYALYKLINMFK